MYPALCIHIYIYILQIDHIPAVLDWFAGVCVNKSDQAINVIVVDVSVGLEEMDLISIISR